MPHQDHTAGNSTAVGEEENVTRRGYAGGLTRRTPGGGIGGCAVATTTKESNAVTEEIYI